MRLVSIKKKKQKLYLTKQVKKLVLSDRKTKKKNHLIGLK